MCFREWYIRSRIFEMYSGVNESKHSIFLVLQSTNQFDINKVNSFRFVEMGFLSNEKRLLFWSVPITASYTTADHFSTSLNLYLDKYLKLVWKGLEFLFESIFPQTSDFLKTLFIKFFIGSLRHQRPCER